DLIVTGVQTCALPICRRQRIAGLLPVPDGDALVLPQRAALARGRAGYLSRAERFFRGRCRRLLRPQSAAVDGGQDRIHHNVPAEIGRASCSERGLIWG